MNLITLPDWKTRKDGSLCLMINGLRWGYYINSVCSKFELTVSDVHGHVCNDVAKSHLSIELAKDCVYEHVASIIKPILNQLMM